MKKLSKIIPILITFVLISGTIVYAGIFGKITGYVKTEAVSVIIGAVIGALGMFGISYKLWGQAVKELGECIWKIYEATRATSNGGKSVTKAEMEKIIKEAMDIHPAVSAAIASHKKNT